MTPDALKELSRKHPLVLGSASPRRVQLLRDNDIPFRQLISDLPEQRQPGEAPLLFAQRMAQEKALRIARLCEPNEIVLGGDTVVILGDEILPKPSSREVAVQTLGRLSGRQHLVATALALSYPEQVLSSGVETTAVFFNQVTREQIDRYVDSGEPMDKAGAYGIQGMGAFLVDRIEGNLDNVVGLPLTLLNRLAREALPQL